MAAATHFQTVQKIYIAFYQRPADPAGLKYWADRIDVAGGDASAVVAAFATSPEAVALYGTIDATTIGSVVDKIYMALFNKAPDAAGKQFYVDGFNAGTFTPGTIALNILNGATGDDAVAINNKAQVANSFTQQVDGRALNDVSFGTGSSFNATYKGDADATAARDILKNVTSSPATVLNQSQVTEEIKTKIADATDPIMGQTGGQTFTLTADQDTLAGTAGNDTYTAGSVQTANAGLQDSLQSVDSINGGAGTDTLNVTLNQGVVAAPSLTSVENVNLRVTAAASSLSLAGATGVTNVTIENSTIASTAITGTVSGVGAANLAVKNQKTAVSFDGSTATTLGLTLDTVGTGGTVAPAHIAVDLGLVAAAKATTLNITANNANADVNATQAGVVTTVNVAATGVNELKLNDAKATATAITVTGAGSVDFVTNGVALTAVKTLTVADGGVTIDATGGVLETATTGAGKDTLTVVGSKVKTISTGAGDDKVTAATDALGATAVVDLGAGNDTLSLAAAPTAGVTLKAGDGTDTLDVAAAAYATITGVGFTDAQRALISGFEVLSLSDATGASGATDLSKLAGLTSFQAKGVAVAGATVSGVGANAAIILKGDLATNSGALTVTLKDATGSADVLNLTINDSYVENNDTTALIEAATATVSAANVETINVTSTGTASTKFLGATGNKADGVVNTLALTDDAVVTLNVSGDQGFKFVSALTQVKLATVDASANTAGADIDVSLAATDGTAAAITLKGSATAANALKGSGNADTIVGGAKADVITGGAGADVLTGGAGNDKFVIAAATDSTLAKMDKITDFVANTFGQGLNGAANADGAKAADSAKWTGDVIDLTAATPTKLELLVVNNAADAQTFIQNSATDLTLAAVNVALDSSTGKLYIDFDNSGTVDTVIELTGVTTITTAAFQIA